MSKSFNCAFVGRTGSGKSSLINALRDVKPCCLGTAKVGVTETTFLSTPYEDPIDPTIVYWDLPGIGSENFPVDEEFMESFEFDSYSLFVIVIATRFTNNDAWIAKQICASGKPFFFVRTKVDMDLRNEQREYPTTYRESRIIQEIKDDCLKNLQKSGLGWQKIFTISCTEKEKYDLYELIQDIHSISEFV